MRRLVERYIRSLREQEQSPASAPEYRQDLGTFVHWLLERHGYRVHIRAFRHDGAGRRTATGERQWGIDITASRREASGDAVGCLFVLKYGDVGDGQWNDSTGSLRHDVLLASELSVDVRQRLVPGEPIAKWEIIAVHNGDFKHAQLGPQREKLIEGIKTREAVDVIWWDAARLTELAMAAPVSVDSDLHGLTNQADAGIFPPGVRPFAQLAIGSLLLGPSGMAFDLKAVERLIDAVLPKSVSSSKSDIINPARWHRRVSELALFAEMVAVECRNRPQIGGTTLPALETYERVICRSVHLLTRMPEESGQKSAWGKAADLMQLLLEKYLDLGLQLHEHMAPILGLENGLALSSSSERLDYPLRSIRLLGYLAVAACVAFDLDRDNDGNLLIETIEQLCAHNAAGAMSPLLDDHVVELSILWDLLLRAGRHASATQTAQEVANRILLRRTFGLRMPALWLSASLPMQDRTLRILVESQFGPTVEYEDGGSQILPLALYIGWRSAQVEEAEQVLRWLAPNTGKVGLLEQPPDKVRPIHLQSWLPPDDASKSWYAESLAHRGTSHVYPNSGSASEFFEGFERFNRPLSMTSIAELLELPSLDRMAWKQFRNPPPMALFVKYLSGLRAIGDVYPANREG
jgi:hypothetical protein